MATPSAEAAVKEAELEQAVKRFQELRSKEQQLLTKINEMVSQEAEYRIVTDLLSPMETDRKAYHLVGSVLAQRTVGEVLPILEANRDAIKQVVGSLDQQLKAATQERAELQKKHGIRVVSREQAEALAREQQMREMQQQQQQQAGGAAPAAATN